MTKLNTPHRVLCGYSCYLEDFFPERNKITENKEKNY